MAATPEFDVTVEVVRGARVVRVRGELDLATTPEFEKAAADDADSRLVVDLSECTFVDSSGIRAILREAETRHRAGGTAVVVATQPATLRVLEIAGVDQALPVVATIADAL